MTESQIKSTSYNAIIKSLITTLVVISIYFIYVCRLEITAKLWHWSHGNSVPFAEYQVPVPDGWIIENQTITSLDLKATHGTKSHSFASITIANLKPTTAEGLDLWKAQTSKVFEGQGLKATDERELHFEDRRVLCLGGYEISDHLQVPASKFLSFDCNSDSNLKFSYFGERSASKEFDEIVSQIHKQSR